MRSSDRRWTGGVNCAPGARFDAEGLAEAIAARDEARAARRVRKETPFLEWKKSVAEETGVPPNRQRYWTFVKRQNATSRPGAPIDPADELSAMSALRDKFTPATTKYNDPEDPRIQERRSLFEWIDAHGPRLGRSYVSSTERYYTTASL